MLARRATASAVLLRAGEVVEGVEIARDRRTTRSRMPTSRAARRGCASRSGITLGDDGADLATGDIRSSRHASVAPFATGPRTGVSGDGRHRRYPWRFWIPGDPTVSPYKRSVPKRRG